MISFPSKGEKTKLKIRLMSITIHNSVNPNTKKCMPVQTIQKSKYRWGKKRKEKKREEIMFVGASRMVVCSVKLDLRFFLSTSHFMTRNGWLKSFNQYNFALCNIYNVPWMCTCHVCSGWVPKLWKNTAICHNRKRE